MIAKPFFKTRFAIRPAENAVADHWTGGAGSFRDATCPSCRVPLLLLAEFNCNDPVLKKASGGKLKNLSRLPLYHCARCWCELSYVVDDNHAVRVVQRKNGNDDPTRGNGELAPQYEGYPTSFPRRPVRLDPTMPSGLRRAMSKWDDLRGGKLSMAERQLLEEFFGHPIFVPRYFYHHQLGGVALHDYWDGTAFLCPNPSCVGGVWDRLKKRQRPMRFLAGIINDPRMGLPIFEPATAETETQWNYFASLYFQICDKCLTITSYSAMD